MTLSLLSVGDYFNGIQIENRKDFWVFRHKENQIEESVVMLIHHDKESVSSIGMALK